MMNGSSRPRARVAAFAVGAALLVGSALLALSLLLAVFPLASLPEALVSPGGLLYSAYGFSAFLVPVLFLWGAILLLVPGWWPRATFLLACSFVPFFTVAGGERLYRSLAGGTSFITPFILGGVAASVVLLATLEFLVFLAAYDRVFARTRRTAHAPTARDDRHDDDATLDGEIPVGYETPLGYESSVDGEVPTDGEIEPDEKVALDALAREYEFGDLADETYGDVATMKAPFDLPQSSSWVEGDGSVAPDEPDEPEVSDAASVDRAEIGPAEPEFLETVTDETVTDETALVDLDDFDFDAEIDADFEDDIDDIDDADDADTEEGAAGAVASAGGMPEAVSVPPLPKTVPPVVRKKRGEYRVPFDVLNTYPDGEYWIIDDTTRRAAVALKETLNEFRIQADVTGIRKGPVITMFEILPAPGVKLSKIVGLADNIALRLAASSVRIVAPIPGKHAVGIEVPNQKRAIVSFRELIESDVADAKKMEIPVILGKDITGEAQLLDLAATPHLLIAGSTGSGKSVCVNSIILSILYKRSPEDVKMILIDPKIVELKLYNDIGHLLSPVITEPKKAFQALQYCLCEMERRYALLDGMGVRDIKSYNHRIRERKIATERIPYIVIIIDEFADLMATTGKELESTVARLCAMSRAVGIHLVLATQRPSIDVITGLIKANIPTRIAFMVASKMDSRIIIDQVGAEKLLGRGDMLYSSATDPFPVRIQGAYVSEEEVERVVEHVKTLGEPEYIDEEIFVDDEEGDSIDASLFGDGDDPLYDKALEIVLLAGKASASYIQRKLKIGYNRAARLVEDMEARGIVGPANGSKPREVVHHP